MSGVSIPVEAKFDASDLDKVLAQLTEQINKLGAKIAEVNKVKFNPIDRATFEDLQKVQTQFGSLTKIAGDFRKRMKDTGQSNSDFFGIDWARMYDSPIMRARQMHKAFNYVTAGTGASFSTPAAPAASGGWSGGGGRNTPNFPPTPGTNWRQQGRGIIGAGLNALGPAGGVANNALSSGMAGGIGAGLAGLAGGLVALGIGKVISGITDKVGAAQTDAIGYDTLKRTLGDLNVSFEGLRAGLHASSDAIDVTYQEAQRLGTEFAHLSGMTAKQSTQLADEVRIGAGFGRSFGLDPSRSVAFFAQMRQLGITSNAQDSQKLALTIGEAISKSGTFSKAGEVLESIASFASQQTRLGLTAANTSGYAGALVGLLNDHVPGLDVAGATSLLSHVNDSISNAASGSEAWQNFMYRAIGTREGIDPIQARMQWEQGAFGSGASTFGPGSVYSRWAKENHVPTPGVASGSSATNLDLVMDQLRKVYAGRPELMADALSKNMHIGVTQAMELSMMTPAQMGGLQSALTASGVDLTKMSATGISALAQISNGNRGDLNEQARSLWSRLSGPEAKNLEAASNGGDTEKLRSVLLQLTAKYGQEQTPGSELRKSIDDLDKDMMDAADKMIGPLNTMRDTLLYAFGQRGSMTSADMHKAVIDAQRKEVNQRADSRISKAQSRLDAASSVDDFGRPIDPKTQKEAYANLQSETAAANKDRAAGLARIDSEDGDGARANSKPGATNSLPFPQSLEGGSGTGATSPASTGSSNTGLAGLKNDSWLVQYLADTDRLNGFSPGTSAAIGVKESGLNPNSVGAANKNGTRDYGMFQINETNLKALAPEFRRLYGRDPNWQDPHDNAILQRMVLANTGGSVRHRLGAYNAGPKNADGTVGQAYADDILNNMLPQVQATGMYDNKVPAGATAPQKNEVSVTVNGDFTLNHPNGTAAAAPVSVSTQVGAPQASGSLR